MTHPDNAPSTDRNPLTDTSRWTFTSPHHLRDLLARYATDSTILVRWPSTEPPSQTP